MIKAFLSYSWNTNKIADDIEPKLGKLDISITRDVRDLKYKGSLSEFMASVKEHELLIVILSEEYLKSKNCMFELCYYFSETGNLTRVLPIVTTSSILSTENRIAVYQYWMAALENEQQTLSNLPAYVHKDTVYRDHDKIQLIAKNATDLLELFADTIYLIYREKETHWIPLLDYLRRLFPNTTTSLQCALSAVTQTKPYSNQITLLKSLYREFPDNDKLRHQEAVIHAQNGHFPLAKRIMQDLLSKNPNDPAFMNNFALVLIDSGADLNQAENLLLQAHAIEPYNVAFSNNLGMFYLFRKNDAHRAKEYIEKAYSIEPDNPHTDAARGLLYMQTQPNNPLIGPLLEKAYRTFPDDWRSVMRYGVYLLNFTNNSDKCLEVLSKALRLSYRNPAILTNLGNLMMQEKKYDSAYKYYTEALIYNPQNSIPYHGLGNIYTIHIKDINKAEECYRKAMELEPENPDYKYDYGILLYECARYHEAATAFATAIRLNPEHTEAKNYLGKILGFYLHQQSQAIAIFDELIKTGYHARKALYNKALLLESTSPTESLLCYETLLDAERDDHDALDRLLRVAERIMDKSDFSDYLDLLSGRYPELRHYIEDKRT